MPLKSSSPSDDTINFANPSVRVRRFLTLHAGTKDRMARLQVRKRMLLEQARLAMIEKMANE